MQIVIATRNDDKLKEIRDILQDENIKILSLKDFPDAPEVEETGVTLDENALLKAKSAAKATGLPALADDTGLMVDELNGAPGVMSARFAGENATYRDNCSLLLSKLNGIEDDKRTAKFVCIAALVDASDSITTRGEIAGIILNEPRGDGGFGYDPIFLPDNSKLSFGEMTSYEKKLIGHRGKAFNKMLEKIRDKYK